jgi:uncharacterized protein (DUF4213/DUF364 family)
MHRSEEKMDYEDLSITLLKHTLHRLRHLYETEGLKPSVVLEIGLKPQWNVVIGSKGQCGMAINFTGIHSLQETPEPDLEKLKSYIGGSLMAMAEEAIPCRNIPMRAIGVAALSALSQPLLSPDSLRSRGIECDERSAVMAELVRSTDIVTVVGYGGLVRSLVGTCKEIHVTEMRPRETFTTTVIGRTVDYGPKVLSIHEERENEFVLGRSDVVILTGSSLVNGTFAELLAYSRRARSIGLYGPSACLIPDVLFEQGVEFVLSHRIRDPERFRYDMVNDIDMETALKAHQQLQVVRKGQANASVA